MALWPLAVVLILAACASPQPATITVAPSADNVVLHQIGPFSGLAGGLIAIDGTRGPFPREVAIDPGRHTLLLENQCGPGVSNRAYARIDMAFAPGTSYRVTGQRHIWENSCRVGLVAEPTGRVICEVETATNEFTHRLVSSLDHVTDHCQGWTYWAVASIGQRRPWAGPFPVVPHDIDDPVALAEMATVGIALLPLRGVDRRRLRSAAKYKQNMYPAVFVVPFAESFPGEPDGVVSGHGVLLPEGYHSTDRLLPSESRYVRVQVGPFSGYRTYFVAWFLLDADALARFDAKLVTGEMLDVQPELGIMVRVWSGYGPPEPRTVEGSATVHSRAR